MYGHRHFLTWHAQTRFRHTATHCNTLQHTATHCNTLQHTATHCDTQAHFDFRCTNTLESENRHSQRAVQNLFEHKVRYISDQTRDVYAQAHFNCGCTNTLQTHCNTLQHTATHCNTLQHTATHCNTLQHTATHRHISTLDARTLLSLRNTILNVQCVAACFAYKLFLYAIFNVLFERISNLDSRIFLSFGNAILSVLCKAFLTIKCHTFLHFLWL